MINTINIEINPNPNTNTNSTRAIPQAPKLFQSYINGEYLETSSIIEKHPVINPAT
eukprot:Awhi_evm1s10285